ncbi:MAG: DUF4292 domain-containing protein [Balneolaceae bacterium]
MIGHRSYLKNLLITASLALLAFTGCRTPQLIETGELEESDLTVRELRDLVPDYSSSLTTLSGSGRALISQPGGSDRVTLTFHSNQTESLVTIRNRLGIEGAQILVQEDSVLIYNRVDQIAEKVSLRNGNLTQVGALTTINLMDLFHYPLSAGRVDRILEDSRFYIVITGDETRIITDKNNGQILEVEASSQSELPYRRILYEEYHLLDGFYLPRKITIFSADESSRVTFLVQQLEANPALPEMAIPIPEDIRILRL